MIGPGLEGRVEARPACAEKLRQALLGQAEVQARQRAERPLALPLALPGHKVTAIGFLRAGDLPDDVLLHQALEGPDIGNLEETKFSASFCRPIRTSPWMSLSSSEGSCMPAATGCSGSAVNPRRSSLRSRPASSR